MSIKRSVCLSLLVLLAGGPDDARAQQPLAEAGNSFGFNLLRQIQTQVGAGENVFVSPLSVAAALGMVYNGAAGATQAAMRETLEFGDLTPGDIGVAYQGLIDWLVTRDPAIEFLAANSIWYARELDVKRDFTEVNREYFGAEVAAVDFRSPTTAPTINGWVAEQTRDRIEEIVEDPIDPDVIMYLINAVYFNGDWAVRFDPELTADGTFYLADGGTKQVPMMTYAGPLELGHLADGNVEAIDLPYGDGSFSMTIVLPAPESEIGALVEWLDGGRWQEIVAGLVTTRTNVLMPKFTLEYEIDLSDVLIALGMGIAFSHDADFSLMCDGGAFISKVKHKAFVDLHEEGTEAAAVTAVEMKRGAPPAVFAVDRPFVFAIRERSSGAILFVGRVVDPTLGG